MKTTSIFFIFLLFTSSIFGQVFEMVWQTDQVLKTPESVCYDEARDQIYVSNINGKPLDKDGNGFISLLARDGSIRNIKWITGMNAPKGMVIMDSLLYVTDIDRIHIVDISKDRIIKTYDVEGAKFLNDLTKDDLGRIYVSDMANGHLLRIHHDSVGLWMDDEQLTGVNGLAYHNKKLMVGTKNQLLKIDTETKTVKVHIDETGPIDGLVLVQGNKYVISDWSGRIQLISPGAKVVLGNSTDDNIQAADLGYIAEDNLILIPTFFDNRVVARKLP